MGEGYQYHNNSTSINMIYDFRGVKSSSVSASVSSGRKVNRRWMLVLTFKDSGGVDSRGWWSMSRPSCKSVVDLETPHIKAKDLSLSLFTQIKSIISSSSSFFLSPSNHLNNLSFIHLSS
ncbi:hypothetical protein L6452_38456 [Arctium lappa]|uniref:Uncharacterized protein n=1 Tax=Arctium lappa TaxID=4217 RepID=A0ACB8XPI8_ARCLA|nr:hypothetical protein L6452_38456 [Arctium lappa]